MGSDGIRLYQISAKSDNLWLNYSDLNIKKFGADLHLGFHNRWISIIGDLCILIYPDFYNKVLCVLELIMLKKNIVYVPSVLLNRNDINVCISAVCSNRS